MIVSGPDEPLEVKFTLHGGLNITKSNFVINLNLSGRLRCNTYDWSSTTLSVVAESSAGSVTIWRGVYRKVVDEFLYIQEYAPLPKGAYTISLVVSRVDPYCSVIADIEGTIYGDNQSNGRGRASIGGNGLVVYLSDNQKLSLVKGEPFRYVGKTDLPGVLASGTVKGLKPSRVVGSTRYYEIANAFGHYVRHRDTDELHCTDIGSDGYYFIAHNIGHSNYQVNFSFVGDNVAGFITSYHRGSTGMWVYVRGRNGDMMRAEFDYTIIGDNR